MWPTPKVFQPPSAQFLHPTTTTTIQDLPTSPSPLPLKHHCQFSRRDLAIFTTTSLLLLGPPQTPDPFHFPPKAQAQTQEIPADNYSKTIPICIDTTPTKRAFLDISINGEPIGRIVIGLYGNAAPAAAARFGDLLSGAAGISYRRKEFVKITPNYVQHGGMRSYGVDAELAKTTGSGLAVDSLRAEWERLSENCPGTKNLEGSVSIIVRDPLKPPPKLKLVAKKGKLEIDEEEVGTDPNGTEFAIATKDSPELDAAALVVGRVLEGMEVVKRIGEVKTVQENTTSPYFRVAKLIGDKRAVVAERGFNRPYAKVVVSNCGLLE